MFSIVIPAFNAEKFITRSIQCVLNQTYKDFELIVIDDGSKDGTKKIVSDFQDANTIKYIYQDNAGVSAARNRGIQESTGDYVCFLDADDEWKEDHLEVLASLIETYNHCGLYVTGYDLRLNNGETIHKSQQILKRIAEENFYSDNGFEILIHNGYFLNTNTVCIKKEVFEKVGLFVQGVKNGEDDDMWFRIFSYYPLAVTKRVTTIYDRSNCGATGQRDVFESTFLGRVDGLLASEEVPDHRKKSLIVWRERHHLSQARKYILAGEKKKAFALFKKVSFQKVNKKKYFETLLCLFLPTKVVKGHIDKRDAAYYQ